MTKTRDRVWGYLLIGVGMAMACTNQIVLTEAIAQSSLAPLSVALGALICATAFSLIAEVASVYPTQPGVRTYVRAAFGNTVSLLSTFVLLSIVVLFASVECHLVGLAVERYTANGSAGFVGALLLVLVVAANLRGLEVPRRIQVWSTLVLLALFAALIAWVFVSLEGVDDSKANPRTFAPGAVGTTIFLFTGIEWITMMGRSPKSYVRNVPHAMLGAVVVLAGVFCGLGAAMEKFLDPDKTTMLPHVDLAEAVGGTEAGLMMLVASLLCVATTFNAGLMGASRLVFALAREGVLPARLKRVSDKGVPHLSVLAVGGAAMVGLVIGQLSGWVNAFALACAALYCWVYAALILSVPRLRPGNGFRPTFRSPVPSWGAVVLGAILLLLGALSVLLAPSLEAYRTLVVLLVAVSICGLGARLATRAQRNARALGQLASARTAGD